MADIAKILLSPVVLTFAIIIAGYYLGKIRISDISLDLSGVLIAAIISGVFIAVIAQRYYNEYIESVADDTFYLFMKTLSSLGTALFVSSVGVSSGYMLTAGAKLRSTKSLFIGIAMVVVSFMTVSAIGALDSSADKSVLMGILCGAMTSTPGLSAVNELEGTNTYLSTAGYGCAYLFGVIGVVLFVQICLKKQRRLCKYTIKARDNLNPKAELYGIVQIALAIVFGTILGSFEIPLIDFSLGTSGGILCSGMVIGFIVSKAADDREISKSNISILRSLGLVFFFVGSGVPAGMNLSEIIEIKYVAYGLIITAAVMISGFVLGQLLNGRDLISSLCCVCGGMTSTPAIGVMCRQCDCEDGLAEYSLAYVGALFAMVVGVRIVF